MNQIRMKLSPPEHYTWLTLRRVNCRGVYRDGDSYLDPHGNPLGMFVIEVLDDLRQRGLLQVGEPAPESGRSPVSLTEAGKARYSQLCKQQRAAP